MFQIETAWTAVIIKSDASLLSFDTLNAAIIPNKIGTTAPALAVAEGTKKANKIETKIAPITILRVLLPTIDSTSKAKRLCNCVSCIAAKIMPLLLMQPQMSKNPLNACVNAFPVPQSAPDNILSPSLDYLVSLTVVGLD